MNRAMHSEYDRFRVGYRHWLIEALDDGVEYVVLRGWHPNDPELDNETPSAAAAAAMHAVMDAKANEIRRELAPCT